MKPVHIVGALAVAVAPVVIVASTVHAACTGPGCGNVKFKGGSVGNTVSTSAPGNKATFEHVSNGNLLTFLQSGGKATFDRSSGNRVLLFGDVDAGDTAELVNSNGNFVELAGNATGPKNSAELENSNGSSLTAFGNGNTLSSENGSGNHLDACQILCPLSFFGNNNRLESDHGDNNTLQVDNHDTSLPPDHNTITTDKGSANFLEIVDGSSDRIGNQGSGNTIIIHGGDPVLGVNRVDNQGNANTIHVGGSGNMVAGDKVVDKANGTLVTITTSGISVRIEKSDNGLVCIDTGCNDGSAADPT